MRRWWIVSVAAAAVVGIAVGVAFHGRLLGTAAAAPPLHGQATWRSGARTAPAFTLRDQDGHAVALDSLRGRTIALTFMDSLCKGACPLEGQLLAAAARALPAAARPRIVIVSVDPTGDTPKTIRRALTKWSLPTGTIWLRGTRAQLKKVWDAYQIDVIPVKGDIAHSSAVYLIDKHGGERAGFLMPFAPGAVIDDLRVLGREAS
jgi:cytochrome oxidase Cu insertion factor (SCO1/SenC/PrrC family)